MTSPIEDEFTELVDADIPRVDLVDKAANGTTFLIAKAGAGGRGLLSPDLVRDLIGKQAAEPEPPREETVTMTGSPAAIAKLIHQAAVRAGERNPVAKEKYDADDRKRMAANGEAMDDGSYPIADHADLTDAVRAVGRGGADHDAIRRHVIQRAKALGAESEIPDNWAADGSLKEVTKMAAVAGELDDVEVDITALDATVVLADAELDAAGDMNEPGSPAWEAIDAATARKWTSIAVRLRNALCVMAERELLEAASADPDDIESAWDLQDAQCALDYVIDTLAGFAVEEQAEAELCTEAMEMVGKALAGFDTAPLDIFEALAPVAKAGRVLSAANEQAIRSAAESLQKVLASLPAAPTADDLTKTANEEDDMPKPTTAEDAVRNAGGEPAMGSQQADPKDVAGQPVTEMAKADEKKMVAVYDKAGNLVGIVDPEKITMIEGAEADDEPKTDAEPEPQADSEATTETPDLTPEPPAEAGTPADTVPNEDDDAVTKTTHQNDTLSEMFKSSLLELVKSALAEHGTAQAAQIADTGDAVQELTAVVETLKGRLLVLEEQPAEPKVFTNGQTPPAEQMRGQDRGHAASQIDVAKARELKTSVYRGHDTGSQNQAAAELQQLAIARLTEIHRGQ